MAMSVRTQAGETTPLLYNHSHFSLKTWIHQFWEHLESLTLIRLVAFAWLDIPIIVFYVLIGKHNARSGWRLEGPNAGTIAGVRWRADLFLRR